MRSYTQEELKTVLDMASEPYDKIAYTMQEKFGRTIKATSIGALIRRARLQLMAVRSTIPGPFGIRLKTDKCLMVRQTLEDAIKDVQGDTSKYELYQLRPLDLCARTILEVRYRETGIPTTGTDVRPK